MGDYEPRGSTNDYGRPDPPPPEPPPKSPPSPPEPPPPGGEAPFDHGPPDPVVPASERPTADERQMAMLAHLGGLLGALFSAGMASFLIPLIIWLVKKDTSEFVDDQGREALNFQLTVLIFGIGFGIFSVAVLLLTGGLAICLVAPILLGFGVYVLVYEIIGCVQANEGKRFRYPICIRLL